MTTSKRNPPYHHANGDNCWTKNCSIRLREEQDRSNFLKQVQSQAQKKSEPVGATLPPFEDFKKAAKDGRVEMSHHPTLPYVSFKYARETQFSGEWDEITLASRGIIFNEETGEVVARPFAKFFNYNEPSVPTDKLHGKVSVTDKLDGSLGIGYTDPDGVMHIATGGSFKSPQAKHATDLYRSKYDGEWEPNPELTYMWEIIYPENRVIVNYDGEDDIYLIGAINKRTGVSVPISEVKEWRWKKPEEYKSFSSLESVLATPDRENREGFIVHYLDTDTRVKYKHGEYLNLHRYATGVTSKSIWRQLKSGEDMVEWKKNLPEEFLNFIEQRETTIQTAFNAEITKIKQHHSQFISTMKPGYDRKTFISELTAAKGISKEDKNLIIHVEVTEKPFTNQVYANRIWDRVKPDDETAFWNL